MSTDNLIENSIQRIDGIRPPIEEEIEVNAERELLDVEIHSHCGSDDIDHSNSAA